jgi:hypothetical protein
MKKQSAAVLSREEDHLQEEWDDLDELIFENGPTKRKVNEWKETYGDVFFTPFEDEIYIWKTLQRHEYRQIIAKKEINPMDREEVFVEKCVLFPEGYTKEIMNNGKAGVPSLLAEMIMDKSGFVAQSLPIKL